MANSANQIPYALDYSRHLTHPLASRVLVPYRRRVDPHYLGCRRSGRDHQTRYRSRSLVGLNFSTSSDVSKPWLDVVKAGSVPPSPRVPVALPRNHSLHRPRTRTRPLVLDLKARLG
jgi:hypothetical protein